MYIGRSVVERRKLFFDSLHSLPSGFGFVVVHILPFAFESEKIVHYNLNITISLYDVPHAT